MNNIIINKFFSRNRILEHKRANLIQKNAKVALESICKLLEVNEVYYWVDAGTLLGIVRDGQFIKNDTDIDIAIVLDDPNILYDLLVENDYNIWYFYEDKDKKKTLIRAEKYSVGIDFEIFVKVENKYYYDASRDLPLSIDPVGENQRAVLRFEFDKKLIEQIISYEFQGFDVKIPKDYDKYFLVYYENWKDKVKKRDYLNGYFSMSVDKYKHHNHTAFYVKDKFLFFKLVNKSTIRITVKDVMVYYLRKR